MGLNNTQRCSFLCCLFIILMSMSKPLVTVCSNLGDFYIFFWYFLDKWRKDCCNQATKSSVIYMHRSRYGYMLKHTQLWEYKWIFTGSSSEWSTAASAQPRRGFSGERWRGEWVELGTLDRGNHHLTMTLKSNPESKIAWSFAFSLQGQSTNFFEDRIHYATAWTLFL